MLGLLLLTGLISLNLCVPEFPNCMTHTATNCTQCSSVRTISQFRDTFWIWRTVYVGQCKHVYHPNNLTASHVPIKYACQMGSH